MDLLGSSSAEVAFLLLQRSWPVAAAVPWSEIPSIPWFASIAD